MKCVSFTHGAILSASMAWQGTAADKTLIDYFLPMPVHGHLTSDAWGAPERPPARPAERPGRQHDEAMVLLGRPDHQGSGRQVSPVRQPLGPGAGPRRMVGSAAVHAVSDNPIGPYADKGLCWPDNQGGKGHNVTALVLPDGRYAVVVSETRPGDVFVSKSLDGRGNNSARSRWTPRIQPGTAGCPTSA